MSKMWFPTDNRPTSTHNTPRTDRRLPKLERPGGISGWNQSDISKTSKTSRGSRERNSKVPLPPTTVPTGKPPAPPEFPSQPQAKHPPNGEKPFFVEDDRKSKITVVSLRSARTSRTVQTAQSSLVTTKAPEPKAKGARGAVLKAKKRIKEGFRESSIKRIVAAGLCVAATLLFLLGVFLPFWSVYTSTVKGVTTGYYGGLWNYCLRTTSGDTSCTTFKESSLEDWFRTVRGLELLAFMCMCAVMGLVAAYMFCLREIKYGYLQWIIIALCFATALFSFVGLIVYGAGESDSGRLSSAYGLTFCAFLGSSAAGAIFLWDKIAQKNAQDPSRMSFRGLSGIPSSRPGHRQGRMSHVRSNRSQVSHGSTVRSGGNSQVASVSQSVRHGGTTGTLAPTQEV